MRSDIHNKVTAKHQKPASVVKGIKSKALSFPEQKEDTQDWSILIEKGRIRSEPRDIRKHQVLLSPVEYS